MSALRRSPSIVAAAGLLLSLGLCALALRSTSDAALLASLGERLGRIAPLALLLVAGEVFCRSARLVLVTAAAGHRLSPAAAIRITLAGDFAAAITPANAGGEPARLCALRREGLPWPRAAMVLAAELATDIVFATGLVCALAAGGVLAPPRHLLRPAVLGLAAAALAGGLLLRRAPRFEACGRLASAFREAREAASALSRRKALLVLAALAAMGHGLLRFAILPVLAAGLAVPIGLRWLILWELVAFYGLAFTPAPGGSGATEVGFLLFFSPLAAPGDVGLLLAAWRLFSYYIYIFAGGIAALVDGTRRQVSAAVA